MQCDCGACVIFTMQQRFLLQVSIGGRRVGNWPLGSPRIWCLSPYWGNTPVLSLWGSGCLASDEPWHKWGIWVRPFGKGQCDPPVASHRDPAGEVLVSSSPPWGFEGLGQAVGLSWFHLTYSLWCICRHGPQYACVIWEEWWLGAQGHLLFFQKIWILSPHPCGGLQPFIALDLHLTSQAGTIHIQIYSQNTHVDKILIFFKVPGIMVHAFNLSTLWA